MPRSSAALAIQSHGNMSAGGVVFQIPSPSHGFTGIIELTSDGQVIYANESARIIAGTSPDESLSVPELLGVHYADLRQLAQAETEPCEYETELTRHGGKRIPVTITVTERATAPGKDANLMITFRSLLEERITSTIREKIRSSKTANEIFLVLADEILKWVPFVHCGASIYNEPLSQARTVFSAGPIAVAWPSRYLNLTPDQAEWLREAKKGPIRDLQLFQQDPRWKAAIDADTARAMSELKSAFRVPVLRDNRVAGSVNFFRNQTDAFQDEFELDLMRNLPIDNVFLIALCYLDNEELRFQMELTKQLADRTTPEILDNFAAEMIVNKLAHHYGWDAITICRVNQHTQRFELQATAGKKSAFIDSNFSQALNEGIMGEAYRKNQLVSIPDIDQSEKYARLFVRKHRIRVQSELCIPIRAGSEIVAILNIEDSHRNAFAKTEVETISDLLENVESMMKRQKDESIINAAFDWAPSALFVLAANGTIEKANPTALKMMGYKAEELVGKSLSDFIKPAEVAARLLHGSAFREDVKLIRKNREPLKVNVASSAIGPTMGAIVTAKDVLSQHRIEELEGLERIFSDIAAQTKVPLALAFSELTSLRQYFQDMGSTQYGRVVDDLEKICRHLRRAEITYDHLALYDKAAAGGVPANPIILEVGKLLNMLLGELPSFDAQRILVTGNALCSHILADVYQVSWVLLSLLSYGLRLLPESKKLEIKVTLQKENGNQWVRFSMGISIPASDQSARRNSDIFIARVISDLSLGKQAIEEFVRANRGRFELPKKLQGDVELALKFPVTHLAG